MTNTNEDIRDQKLEPTLEERRNDLLLELEQRVKSGVKMLDEVYPYWDQAINLSLLDLSSITSCILGQLYGNFTLGVDTIRAHYPDMWDNAEEHGFDTYTYYTDQKEVEWKMLDHLWSEEIESRRTER